MKHINCHRFLLGTVFSLGIICSTNASAGLFSGCGLSMGTYGGLPYHTPIFGFATFDVGSAAGRILTTAVKYFLSDDTDLVAQLVWKKGCGGCGGCYKEKADSLSDDLSSDATFKATTSEISVEEDIYRTNETIGKGGKIVDTIGQKCVAALAQQRLDSAVTEQASLANLNRADWAIQYQSQRRSIQALTDALNMKRLYNDIKDSATSVKSDYSDYSAAVSSVASKRLLLDQLLALKKRVVAARVRVRAQTLELNGADLKLVTTAPDLSGVCTDEPAPGGEGGNPEGGASGNQ